MMGPHGTAWQEVGYDRTFRRDVSRGVWVQVVPDAWQVALSDVWRRFPKRGARWRVEFYRRLTTSGITWSVRSACRDAFDSAQDAMNHADALCEKIRKGALYV